MFPCGIYAGEWGSKYYPNNGLSERGFHFIEDIFTIATTLGMKLDTHDLRTRQWEMGKLQKFYSLDGEIFAEMRPYMNGNLHAKLNKNFILRLNIEAGKLNGWIKDPAHAAKEMDIPVKEIVKFFKCHKKIDITNQHLLLEAPEEEEGENIPVAMELF